MYKATGLLATPQLHVTQSIDTKDTTRKYNIILYSNLTKSTLSQFPKDPRLKQRIIITQYFLVKLRINRYYLQWFLSLDIIIRGKQSIFPLCHYIRVLVMVRVADVLTPCCTCSSPQACGWLLMFFLIWTSWASFSKFKENLLEVQYFCGVNNAGLLFFLIFFLCILVAQ